MIMVSWSFVQAALTSTFQYVQWEYDTCLPQECFDYLMVVKHFENEHLFEYLVWYPVEELLKAVHLWICFAIGGLPRVRCKICKTVHLLWCG